MKRIILVFLVVIVCVSAYAQRACTGSDYANEYDQRSFDIATNDFFSDVPSLSTVSSSEDDYILPPEDFAEGPNIPQDDAMLPLIIGGMLLFVGGYAISKLKK